MRNKTKLVIFDFDGTLYDGDSMIDFVKYVNKSMYYPLLFKFAIISLFSLNPLTLDKKIFLKIMLGKKGKSLLNKKSISFYELHRNKIKPEARLLIKRYLKENWDMVISTASLPIWIKPFADHLNMKFFASYYQECKNKEIILTLNNKGENKLFRIREDMDLSQYEEVLSYGDSKEDLYLEEISTVHYRVL